MINQIDLERRLADLSVEHDPAALERAVASAPATAKTRRTRRRFAAGAGTVALAALLVSPWGQALAGAVGDLVGVGDAPTRTAGGEPTGSIAFPESSDQVVIATGQAPNGLRYEMIASAGREDIPLERPGDTGMCVDLDLPQAPSAGEDYHPFSCINDTVRRSLTAGKLTPHVLPATEKLGPDTLFLASGWLPLDIASAEVTYESSDGSADSAPVALGRIEGEVAEEIGAPDDYGFYAAFIPPEALQQDPAGNDFGLDRCEAREMLAGISATFTDEDGNKIGPFPASAGNSVQLVAMQPTGFETPKDTREEFALFGPCDE